MRPKSETNFERKLLGPEAYDRFNNISKICQSRYLWLILGQGLLLVIIAILGAFSYSAGDVEWWVRFTMVSLSVIVLVIVIYQQNKNYMKGWQNARFIAESVLSNAWLFAFKVGNYDDFETQARKAFLDNIEKIEKEVELRPFLDLFASTQSPIAEWMIKLFNEPNIAEKKSFYIKNRLDNQIDWYTEKSRYNRRRANLWFAVSLILLLVGILLTLIVPLYQFSVLGLLSTVTATILTLRQTKRFDELKVTYAVAAKELRSLKAKFELENDTPDILKYVEEAEKSISREHKLWFNWTYIT